jgi:predicted CopG family antitoxin
MSSKLRQIAVDEGNYRTLKKLGQAGDSFNDVITEVLKKMKNEEATVAK